MIDYDNILIRCSKLHTIMTNVDKPGLSKGHITECRRLYRELKWRRRPILKVRTVQKGRIQEQDAVTLLSRMKKEMLNINTERITNKFLSGTPDIYKGPSIHEATHGWDTKCSWDPFTFPYPDQWNGTMYGMDPEYYFQNMGYMALTGAKEWTTVYCLVNAPAFQIVNEKYSLQRAMGDPGDGDPAFIDGCKEIEKNMIYDMDQFQRDNPHFDLHSEIWDYDIPMNERLIEFKVTRDESMIDKIYERVELVRKEIQKLAGKDKVEIEETEIIA